MKRSKLFLCALLSMIFVMMFGMSVHAEDILNGLVEEGGVTYYYENGEKVTDSEVWFEDGLRYFDENGVMVTGWKDRDGTWYYYGTDGIAVEYGWKQIGSTWYYFYANGRMVSDEKIWDGQAYYYLDASGAMVASRWIQMKPYEEASEMSWYYFGADGKGYTSVQQVGGTTYFFYGDGQLYESTYSGVTTTYDGTYIVEVSGDGVVSAYAKYAINGWTLFKGDWYYFEAEYDPADYGWKEIGGVWYYFIGQGRMASDTIVYDDGDYYYVNASGQMVSSAWVQTGGEYGDGLAWIYLGTDGKAYQGIQNVGGTEYYFNYNCELYEGYSMIQYDSTYLYKVEGNGVVSSKVAYAIGQWVSFDGEWYYFEDAGIGAEGLKDIGGKSYYFVAGKMMKDTLCWDYNTYSTVGAVDKDGNRVKNAWYLYKEGYTLQWYFFEADGSPAEGWKQYGSDWYYFYEGMALVGDYIMEYQGTDYYYNFATDGRMLKQLPVQNGWIQNGSIWYYWDGDGLVTEEWRTIGGYDYYFDIDGWMVTSSVADDGYVVDANGHWVKNTWVSVYGDNYWVYADENGKAVTGWKQLGSTWYWFDDEGLMADYAMKIYNEETGKEEIHNFASNGAWLGQSAVTNGWSQYDGSWHYYENGSLVRGWKAIGGQWYYFDKYDGIMYSDTCTYIDDQYYVFTANGSLANGWLETEWGTWYLADANGVAKRGWQQVGGTWYYLDHYMYEGLTYIEAEQAWHLFSESGAWLGKVNPVDGWNCFAGVWYYFENDNLTYGWIESNGQYYFMDPNMLTDFTIAYSGDYWAPGQLDGKVYGCGFNADGTIAKNRYVYIEGFGNVWCDNMGMFCVESSSYYYY